jgi:hypothetical protein
MTAAAVVVPAVDGAKVGLVEMVETGSGMVAFTSLGFRRTLLASERSWKQSRKQRSQNAVARHTESGCASFESAALNVLR